MAQFNQVRDTEDMTEMIEKRWTLKTSLKLSAYYQLACSKNVADSLNYVNSTKKCSISVLCSDNKMQAK